jgi:hypothetical protein
VFDDLVEVVRLPVVRDRLVVPALVGKHGTEVAV